MEQASRQTYYYGFMPKRTYGLAGLGYMPGNEHSIYGITANNVVAAIDVATGAIKPLAEVGVPGVAGLRPLVAVVDGRRAEGKNSSGAKQHGRFRRKTIPR